MLGSILLFGCFFAVSASPKPDPVQLKPLIVGGVDAGVAEFPFLVSIRINGAAACGGTLIKNGQWVLTAAHCAVFPRTSYLIVAGEHNLAVRESSEQYRYVSKIATHPNYDRTTFSNDIALLKLSSKFNLNLKVKDGALPASNFVTPSTVVVTGWGTLSEGGSQPNILQKVTIPVIPSPECKAKFASQGINANVRDSNFCAGETGKDSCSGDSGGPTICETGNSKVVCGLVSFGYGCARQDLPGINTRVAFFRTWVDSITRLF